LAEVEIAIARFVDRNRFCGTTEKRIQIPDKELFETDGSWKIHDKKIVDTMHLI